MAQSLFKVVLLFLLASSCVLLLSTTIALNFMLEQRREYFVAREKGKQGEDGNEEKNETDEESDEVEEIYQSKTIRSSFPVQTTSELKLHHKTAPNSRSYQVAAEAHLGIALRHIEFEQVGGILKGNGLPPDLEHAEYGLPRGVGLVKHPHEKKPFKGTKKEWIHNKHKGNSQRRREDGSDSTRFFQSVAQFQSSWNNWFSWTNESSGESLSWNEWKFKIFENREYNNDNNSGSRSEAGHKNALTEQQTALFHLEKASEMGNHHAMNMIANTLASGILPVDNSDKIIALMSKNNETTLQVPDDFSSGGSQLGRAIVLWHASAMEGNIESAMSLGYRHWYSALGGRVDGSSNSINTMIRDADVLQKILHEHEESNTDTIDSNGNIVHQQKSKPDKPQQSGRTHSASSSAHYGALGTCESAMTYYEVAANAIMDDLESSPLRGKTAPYIDDHQLAEIHIHGGASSALAHHNKPDELEEALQYYRIRASRTNAEPDLNAAYTLANLYHYGIRGVKQDLKLALKYYEIAADLGSWEASGQAGKFHLWGMGIEEEGRDLEKALKYFRKGAPAGLEGCTYRLKVKSQQQENDGKKTSDDEENASESSGEADDSDIVQSLCDHPCVNGMGLLHAFGIPNIVPINLRRAENYFLLGRDMGNMDSAYNLALLRLGWLKHRAHRDPVDIYHNEIENEDVDIDDLSNDLTASTGAQATDLAKKLLGNHAVVNNRDEVVKLSKALNNEFIRTEETKRDDSNKNDKEKTTLSNKNDFSGPTFSDYSFAMTELVRASNRGHLQAKHRLAMMYARGITVPNRRGSQKPSVAVSQSCTKALFLYKEIADAGITNSRRLRAAYKQYVKGDYDASLRNYLAAAETGSTTAQINAAFLLERGHCLGLSHFNCMKASVRLWKAAAKQGNEEACLRVGDFYYYGRLSEEKFSKKLNKQLNTFGIGFIQRTRRFASFPFWWVRYILYPEDLAPITKQTIIQSVRWLVSKYAMIVNQYSASSSNQEPNKDNSIPIVDTETTQHESTISCRVDDIDGNVDQTCQNKDLFPTYDEDAENRDILDERGYHLSTAAHYYRKAAELYDSPRANFNLGFMHQWGLGLKQDFPLAKRHFDLASTTNSGNAELAVKIALFCMKAHEDLTKYLVFWKDWQKDDWAQTTQTTLTGTDKKHRIPNHSNSEIGNGDTSHKFPTGKKKRTLEIVLSHVLTWETVLLAVLAVAFTMLLNYRRRTGRRQ